MIFERLCCNSNRLIQSTYTQDHCIDNKDRQLGGNYRGPYVHFLVLFRQVVLIHLNLSENQIRLQ